MSEWRQTAQDGVQFHPDNYEKVGKVNAKFNMAGAKPGGFAGQGAENGRQLRAEGMGVGNCESHGRPDADRDKSHLADGEGYGHRPLSRLWNSSTRRASLNSQISSSDIPEMDVPEKDVHP